MTLDPQMVGLLSQLGTAAPLIGILVMLLRAADSERRDITKNFLGTLENTIRSNADGSARLAGSLADMTKAITERNAAATAEHQKMLEVLNDMVREVKALAQHERERGR